MQSVPRGERKNSPVQPCPLHTAFYTKVWNATVNIVRSQPFQVGTQRLSHWLLHSACVCGVCQCNGRRQMIPLLCGITSTHCSDSPERHPTGFTSAPNASPLSTPVSADYSFPPPDPSLDDNNTATCFSTRGGTGLEALPLRFQFVWQNWVSVTYRGCRNAEL